MEFAFISSFFRKFAIDRPSRSALGTQRIWIVKKQFYLSLDSTNWP